jgi:hypothetical protein
MSEDSHASGGGGKSAQTPFHHALNHKFKILGALFLIVFVWSAHSWANHDHESKEKQQKAHDEKIVSEAIKKAGLVQPQSLAPVQKVDVPDGNLVKVVTASGQPSLPENLERASQAVSNGVRIGFQNANAQFQGKSLPCAHESAAPSNSFGYVVPVRSDPEHPQNPSNWGACLPEYVGTELHSTPDAAQGTVLTDCLIPNGEPLNEEDWKILSPSDQNVSCRAVRYQSATGQELKIVIKYLL